MSSWTGASCLEVSACLLQNMVLSRSNRQPALIAQRKWYEFLHDEWQHDTCTRSSIVRAKNRKEIKNDYNQANKYGPVEYTNLVR